MTNRNLAVFDFDWSLIEQDSDDWTLRHLYQGSENELTSGTEVWTDVMDRAVRDMQDKGLTEKDFIQTLKEIPFTDAMLHTLKELHAHSTRVLILSDANSFYIETILKAYNVHGLVDDIITNPVYTDDQGRFRIRRLVPASDPPHNCPNTCTVNICKGKELDRYIKEHGPFNQIMYVGDGKNDFCPSTRLEPKDRLFVRKGKALELKLESEPKSLAEIKAKMTMWKSSEEVLQAVKEECL